MKQTSWLSGLAAVRRSRATARARTSALVKTPTGKRIRASWAWVSMWTTYDWSFGPSAPRRSS